MIFFILLIDVLLPVLLLSTISYVIYKYITIISSRKKWLNEMNFHKDNRYSLPFNIVLEDWAKFVFFSNSNIPNEVILGLAKVTESLKNIENKAKTEHWFNEKNKLPQNFYPVVDILYKHFPELINEYLEIPRKIADTKRNLQGNTATYLLIENTKLLVNTIETKTQELFDDNLNKMTSQQIHFKDKFADNELEL